MSEEAPAEAPAPWEVPAIEREDGQVTAGRLEALQREAYDEAFKRGHAEGLAAGEEAAEARSKRFEQLLNALARPLDALDETVEKQLVELAMTVVKQLFRREIRVNPSHVIGVVREAIRLLPVASRNVQLHLHPEDAALVREALSPTESEPAWILVEDPLITRGGCRVTTDNSQIDASVESRLNAVISSIAGDERQ